MTLGTVFSRLLEVITGILAILGIIFLVILGETWRKRRGK